MAHANPPLILFHHPLSSSLPALLLLAHLNIPHTLITMTSDSLGVYVPVDPSIARDDFLAMNPLGQVPTLVLDHGQRGQVVITQLTAVLSYVSCLRDSHGMSGRDALEQAKVQEWLSYISATFTITGFTQIFRPTRVVGEAAFEEVLQAVRNVGYEIVVAGLYHVETRLDDSGFAVGYHLTVVDFLLWTVWGWADRAGLRTQTDRVSKLRGVVERVGKVERLQDVLAREKGEDRVD